MKKDGAIILSGREITIEGISDVRPKSSRNIVLEGSKILQN